MEWQDIKIKWDNERKVWKTDLIDFNVKPVSASITVYDSEGKIIYESKIGVDING